jgi:serine acetyltransferase
MLIGAKLPSGAVVAAGSVVAKDFSSAGDKILLAGNPAVLKERKKRVIDNQEPRDFLTGQETAPLETKTDFYGEG